MAKKWRCNDETYQAREDAIGSELMRELENLVMLKVVDNHWMEHLDAMGTHNGNPWKNALLYSAYLCFCAY